MLDLNGINIAWENVTITVLGSAITKVTKIEYKATGNHVANYGAGNKPVSYGMGQIRFNASIEMYQDAWQTISALAGGSPGNLNPIGNDILITVSPTENSIIDFPFTDILHDVKFLEDSMSIASGDTRSLITIPLLISDISRFG